MSQILLPWQRGSLREKFAWHHLMAWPRKPPYRRKNYADVFYISRIITNFVSNFVDMATRVSRGKIRLAAFDGPCLKPPLHTQKSCKYLLHRPSYSEFCTKICCHGNRGRQERNLTSDSPALKIWGRCKQRAIIFCGGRVIANFVQKFVAMATGINKGKI